MTVLVDALRYERTEGLLWRDTGRHVLVLPPGSKSQVLVLGGGGGAIWRLLERPHSLREVMSFFADQSEPAPELADLLTCLDELADRGLLRVSGESDDDS